MTIKEMIKMLNEAARDSKLGENAPVELYSCEEGTYDISEVYVAVDEGVVIRANN